MKLTQQLGEVAGPWGKEIDDRYLEMNYDDLQAHMDFLCSLPCILVFLSRFYFLVPATLDPQSLYSSKFAQQQSAQLAATFAPTSLHAHIWRHQLQSTNLLCSSAHRRDYLEHQRLNIQHYVET
jgi:hypothetical protein